MTAKFGTAKYTIVTAGPGWDVYLKNINCRAMEGHPALVDARVHCFDPDITFLYSGIIKMLDGYYIGKEFLFNKILIRFVPEPTEEFFTIERITNEYGKPIWYGFRHIGSVKACLYGSHISAEDSERGLRDIVARDRELAKKRAEDGVVKAFTI